MSMNKFWKVVALTAVLTLTAHTAGTGRTDGQRISYKIRQVGDVKIFYREAGLPSRPTVVLLHGYPSSSHMFRDLIPKLAGRYHIIAPDLPGFGYSDQPQIGRAHV